MKRGMRDRIGCWHFWRRSGRDISMHFNACRPCRAALARRLARGAPVVDRYRGERGPELFIPPGRGGEQIVPNHMLRGNADAD